MASLRLILFHQFLHWEVIVPQIANYWVIKILWHLLFSVQYPKVTIVRVAHNDIVVILSQSDDPVLPTRVWRWTEFNCELRVSTIIRGSFTYGARFFAVSGACVVHLYRFLVIVKRICRECVRTTLCKICWNGGYLIPYPQILFEIDVRDCNWLLKLLFNLFPWLNKDH